MTNGLYLVYHIQPLSGGGILLALLFGKGVFIFDFLHLEATLGNTTGVVTTIDATVVVLSEDAGTLLGRGYRVILEGLLALVVLRYKHHSPAVWRKYSVQFAQRLAVILDVFEEMVTNHNIHALIFERNGLHIEVHLCQRTLQVGRYVAVAIDLAVVRLKFAF